MRCELCWQLTVRDEFCSLLLPVEEEGEELFRMSILEDAHFMKHLKTSASVKKNDEIIQP